MHNSSFIQSLSLHRYFPENSCSASNVIPELIYLQRTERNYEKLCFKAGNTLFYEKSEIQSTSVFFFNYAYLEEYITNQVLVQEPGVQASTKYLIVAGKTGSGGYLAIQEGYYWKSTQIIDGIELLADGIIKCSDDLTKYAIGDTWKNATQALPGAAFSRRCVELPGTPNTFKHFKRQGSLPNSYHSIIPTSLLVFLFTSFCFLMY